MTKESKEYSRRLVIVTGDKGGVGKSTFARALVQAYLDTHQDFVAFDADMSNPQIKRFYESDCTVFPLDIFTRGEADLFLENLKTLIEPIKNKEGEIQSPGKSLFLLELPPQSMKMFREFACEMNFFEIADKNLDLRVTMATVISRTRDSVNQLLHLYDFCKGEVDYVIVKNLFFGKLDGFERYDTSPSIKEIKEKGIALPEIPMADLIAHAYDYLDFNNFSFSQGILQDERISVKGRVGAWMKNFKASIDPVKDLLGLKDVTF
jgi:hypothetical protein